MKRAHVFVLGEVQGIGFRNFVRWQARSLGLTGWVKNLPDGRVEVLVEGEESKVLNLLRLIKEGPPLAEVKRVDIDWEESSGQLSGFEVN